MSWWIAIFWVDYQDSLFTSWSASSSWWTLGSEWFISKMKVRHHRVFISKLKVYMNDDGFKCGLSMNSPICFFFQHLGPQCEDCIAMSWLRKCCGELWKLADSVECPLNSRYAIDNACSFHRTQNARKMFTPNTLCWRINLRWLARQINLWSLDLAFPDQLFWIWRFQTRWKEWKYVTWSLVAFRCIQTECEWIPARQKVLRISSPCSSFSALFTFTQSRTFNLFWFSLVFHESEYLQISEPQLSLLLCIHDLPP